MTSRQPIDCATCQHFRPQGSFVDLYKTYDTSAPRGPIMESLKAVQKEERQVLEQEVEHLFELFRAEELTWPMTPRMAPYCAAGPRPQVASLKNRWRDCDQYEAGFARSARACRSCSHVADPDTRIGDRENPIDRHDPEYWKHWMGVNKEQETADASAQGLEIEQAFQGDGILPSAQFLPTCGARSSPLGRLVVPFCNSRGDCAEHRPLMPLPSTFMTAMQFGAFTRPQDDLLSDTVALAKAVAATHPNQPTAFLRSAPARLRTWSKFAVTARWLDEVGELPDGEKDAALREAGAQTPAVDVWPVIAGCDVLEWGALAASAKGRELMVAVMFAQQIAEWLAGTFHPTQRMHGIAAARALLCSGIFPAEVVDFCEPLVLRAKGLTSAEHATLLIDPTEYVEARLLGLSQRVRHLRARQWMRAGERESRRKGLTEEMAESMGLGAASRRAKLNSQLAIGRQVAAILLRHLSLSLIMPSLGDWQPLWREVTEGDSNELRNEILTVLQAEHRATESKLGMSQDMNLAIGKMLFEQQSTADARAENLFQRNDALALRNKRLALQLLLARGAHVVSPCAFDILGRTSPAHDRVPLTLEEALTEPTGRTLEVFHGKRWSHAPRAVGYVARTRRLGSPIAGLDMLLP